MRIFSTLKYALAPLFFLLYSTSALSMGFVGFYSGYILVSYNNGTEQVIKADIEPDFIDYTYIFTDIDSNGKLDLVVSELNDFNSTSFVYLYDNIKEQFDSKVSFHADSIFKSENYTCTISSNRLRGSVELRFMYKDGVIDEYMFDYVSEKLTNKPEEMTTDEFDRKLEKCTSQEYIN